MKTTFAIISMAIASALATTVPSKMGVEVIRQDGEVIVREVVSCRAKPRSRSCCS